MRTVTLNKNIQKYSIGLLNDTIEIEIFKGTKDIGVMLIPPDPNWGGTKDTPVIDHIFWHLVENNIAVQRFSFTRYPIINHNYDRYISQVAICVEEFIETAKLPTNFFIIGYSFGATIALNMLLRRPELSAAVLISPPVNYYNMVSWLSSYKTTIAMMYGDNDNITPVYVYNEYIDILHNNDIDVVKYCFRNTDHYYTNALGKLEKTVLSFINKYIDEKDEKTTEDQK